MQSEVDRTHAWVSAYAEHVRKRFNSRALVSVRLGAGEPVELSHVYALESGGLVLVTCCTDAEHGQVGHSGVPEHQQGVGAAERKAHKHGNEHEHDGGDEHEHGHSSGGSCKGAELWLASPELAFFEAHCAADGTLCTGFGYLGLSRTPHVLIPRGTRPPAPKGHEHGDF